MGSFTIPALVNSLLVVTVPRTTLHNAEPDFTNRAADVWWVHHLTRESPIVGRLQVPDDNGCIVLMNVPIPSNTVFKPPSKQIGLALVKEHLVCQEEDVLLSPCGTVPFPNLDEAAACS